MIRKPVTIQNNMDMEDRPVAHLVQEASQYASQVYIVMGSKKINAKSIMMIIGGCIKCGMEVEVVCNGEQETECLAELKELFLSGFGE